MKSQMIFLDSMSHMEGNWCERKIILLIVKMRYAIIANPASGKKTFLSSTLGEFRLQLHHAMLGSRLHVVPGSRGGT